MHLIIKCVNDGYGNVEDGFTNDQEISLEDMYTMWSLDEDKDPDTYYEWEDNTIGVLWIPTKRKARQLKQHLADYGWALEDGEEYVCCVAESRAKAVEKVLALI